MGYVAQEMREYAQARDFYQQALSIYIEFGDCYEQARTYHQLGIVAQQVITAREIQLEWVARVLAEPQKTEPDREDPELRHALARIPENGNRVLRVVYNENKEPWRIITVYFDRTQRNKL